MELTLVNTMNSQTFQIVITVATILFAIIGFLIVWVLRSFKERLDSHSERMDSQDETFKEHKTMIDKNSSDIISNGREDAIHRDYMKSSIDRVELALGEVLKKLGAENAKE